MCPRDLLVKEMHYFADYLSSDTHHYDDVDISVHCDIGIFDWLMQYVKRGLLEDTAGNVVSDPLKKPSFSECLCVLCRVVLLSWYTPMLSFRLFAI